MIISTFFHWSGKYLIGGVAQVGDHDNCSLCRIRMTWSIAPSSSATFWVHLYTRTLRCAGWSRQWSSEVPYVPLYHLDVVVVNVPAFGPQFDPQMTSVYCAVPWIPVTTCYLGARDFRVASSISRFASLRRLGIDCTACQLGAVHLSIYDGILWYRQTMVDMLTRLRITSQRQNH